MILWPLLLLSSALAQDLSIEEYCFFSVTKMQQVSARLKFIMIPADKLVQNERCFTLSTPDHRRELILNYVRNIDPYVQINFSSTEIRRDPCHIKVEKVKALNSKSTSGKVTTDINVDLSTGQAMETFTDTSNIQTIKEFELTINQDRIKGECRSINSSLYEIKIEVAKEMTRGTDVPVTDTQINQMQQTSRLQTTLQLQRGQRLEIGHVIRKLRNDASMVDVQKGAELDKVNETENDKVFLSLD